jgi:hypothetical protein
MLQCFRAWLAIGALACTTAATAQIHKCVDGEGRTTFSQAACPVTQVATRIEVALAPTAARAEPGCRPLSPATYDFRRRQLVSALASPSNSRDRSEALQLALVFLDEEERYDQLEAQLAQRRDQEMVRVASADDETRGEALTALRGIFVLHNDWQQVRDGASGVRWACRSLETGAFGPDSLCRCKPRRDRWAND